MSKSNIGAHTGVVLSVSAMHMFTWGAKIFQTKIRNNYSDIASFNWAINPLFSAIKSMVVLIRFIGTEYDFLTTSIISCLHLIDML